MAVTVVKIYGSCIPHDLRKPGVEVVFKVTGRDGEVHHIVNDQEAAKLAVRLSGESLDPSQRQEARDC